MEHKSDGIIEKHKARLVAKGFNQRQGIDFDKTFNPMVKLATICLMLPIDISYGWPIHQLEVKNVFCHDLIDKDVYMFQLKGFIDPARPDFVCKLNRAIYGFVKLQELSSIGSLRTCLTSVLKDVNLIIVCLRTRAMVAWQFFFCMLMILF